MYFPIVCVCASFVLNACPSKCIPPCQQTCVFYALSLCLSVSPLSGSHLILCRLLKCMFSYAFYRMACSWPSLCLCLSLSEYIDLCSYFYAMCLCPENARWLLNAGKLNNYRIPCIWRFTTKTQPNNSSILSSKIGRELSLCMQVTHFRCVFTQ